MPTVTAYVKKNVLLPGTLDASRLGICQAGGRVGVCVGGGGGR